MGRIEDYFVRDPDRINRIIEKLRAVWFMQPDSRLCQIIVNNFSADPYYVEDDVVEEELDKILKG
jgi:hypothetical protein